MENIEVESSSRRIEWKKPALRKVSMFVLPREFHQGVTVGLGCVLQLAVHVEGPLTTVLLPQLEVVPNKGFVTLVSVSRTPLGAA